MKIIHVICVFLSLLCSATFKNVVVKTTAISFDIENKFGRVRTTESDTKITQYKYDSRGGMTQKLDYRYRWEFGEYSERLDYKKQWKHKHQRIKVQ